jgi:hypothetical protein
LNLRRWQARDAKQKRNDGFGKENAPPERAACRSWRDLGRDWRRWSVAERIAAGGVLVAILAEPLIMFWAG